MGSRRNLTLNIQTAMELYSDLGAIRCGSMRADNYTEI